MTEESKHPDEKQKEAETELEKRMSEEDQVRLILEQARQEVKRIAKKEREGETITRELLSFRMRHANDA